MSESFNTSRRSFFSRAAAMVAIISIAPEIAFRVRLNFDWSPDRIQEYHAEVFELARQQAQYFIGPSFSSEFYSDQYLKSLRVALGGKE